MSDCEYRKPGQDFCDDCPLRPVRDECHREGFCVRTNTTPQPSVLQRIGVFILSALALMTIPVVYRNMLRLGVEGDAAPYLITALSALGMVFMVVVFVAAFYGLYASVWQRRPKSVA